MAVARQYEIMLVLDPRLDDAQIQQAIEKYVGVITEHGGEAGKVDQWGRRKLAYEIDHLHEGYYVVAGFTAGPDAVNELDRVLKLADEAIRHKIIRPGKD
ncbi:MAG TPA: 30S ribosomal protein S6 [Actinomycetota bacterium]